MSILIKDMEMPKEGTVMAIYKLDGRFYASVHGTELCPLIEIPEHDCVDLAEKVTATFYSEEYEEWTQQTVTIADILDSVCDDYTILPSAQRKGKWINKNGIINCSVCVPERGICDSLHIRPRPWGIPNQSRGL